MVKRSIIMLVGVLALSLAALLAVGAVPAAAQSEGRITGIVYADKNGNGIREEGEQGVKDARVNFATAGWDTTINSDDTGAFSIDLNPATYTVSIIEVPAGYFQPDKEDVTVEVTITSPGEVQKVEFGLVPEGTVLPASGGVVSGALVIGGLAALVAVGAVLVVVGQRRSRNPSA